jgi:hypothetical protein
MNSMVMHSKPTPAVSETSFERSGFVIFAEYCSHSAPDPKEVTDLIGNRWSLKPSIFHLSTSIATQLGSALNLQPQEWSRALGHDLLDGWTSKSVLIGELRHCPICLAKGWHSAVFQHPAVQRCPIDHVRLQFGCVHCGAAIRTSAIAIARNHFHCGTCGRSLAPERRRSSPTGPIVQISVTHFDGLRGCLSSSASQTTVRSPFRWESTPEAVARSPANANALAFHRAWPSDHVDGVRAFKQTELKFAAGEKPLSPADLNRRARAAAVLALAEVGRTLEEQGILDQAPSALATTRGSSARIDTEMSVVCAAYWKTALQFHVLREIEGELPRPDARAAALGDALPRTAGAAEAVVTAQVEGMLVANLLELRNMKYTAEVAWNHVPDAPRFHPAWTARLEAGWITLNLRQRASRAMVFRLVQRYQGRRLHRVPEQIAILDVVQEGRSDVTTKPVQATQAA